MSIIVYKQMFRKPNLKDTPTCNYAYVRYIATRRGVMKNENMAHGLFGKVNPCGDTVYFNDWRELAKQAYEFSKRGCNVFRSIISFRRVNANELGLKNQEEWKNYIEEHIKEIANQNNIKIENLRWACAVHDERHHPHCHVVFWDDTQIVRKKSVSSKIPNNIRLNLIKETFSDKIKEYFENQYKEGNAVRKSLIKSTYSEELSELYKEKDFIAGEIKTITDEMVSKFEMHMHEQYPAEYAELITAFETFDESSIDAEPVYNCFNPEIMEFLGKQLLNLKDKIPRTGRISYKLLPPDIKSDIDSLVALLLKNNKSLHKAVRLFVNSKLKVLEMYTSNAETISKAKKDYKKEAEKIIVNRVLAAVKSMLKDEHKAAFEKRNSEYREYQAEQLIIGLLDLFSRLCISSARIHDEYSGMAMSTEPSKKARKEYYIAHKDKDKNIER